MKHTNRLLIFTITCFLFFFASSSEAQTWETFFKKSEKLLDKGKPHKVAKKMAKLRKKKITKKFEGDSALFAFTHVMDAKAYEVRSEYKKMAASIRSALEMLEEVKDQDPYAYATGMLRLVDVYNAYGNPLKADSLLGVLQSASAVYQENELLQQEVAIRDVFTKINNGFYLEADSLLQPLVTSWPDMYPKSYGAEEVDKLDVTYRQELMALLYDAQIEILVSRGRYAEAEQLINDRKRDIIKLAGGDGPGYFRYRQLEVQHAIDQGDWSYARRLSSRYVGSKPVGKYREMALDNEVRINVEEEQFEDAAAAVLALAKYQRKQKTNKTFSKYQKDYYVALISLYEGDFTKGMKEIGAVDRIPGEKVPFDHPMRAKVARTGIKYLLASANPQHQMSAAAFLEREAQNFKLRYVENSLFHKINQISWSGYYLNFSETPLKASPILDRKPYEQVFRQIDYTHHLYPDMVDDMAKYFVLEGQYDFGIELYTRAVKGLRENENTPGMALGEKMVSLAKMQVKAGAYQEAEENTDEALKLIRRDERQSAEYIYALNSAAMLYGTIGLFDKAERLLNRSTSIAKKLDSDNKEIRLRSIEDLAFLYTRIGNYTETEALLSEVIEERKKTYGNNSLRLIKPYNALGEMYMIRGEYPDAEKNIRKSLEIAERVYGDSTLLYAENLSVLVKLYLELGNYESGLINCNRVFDIRKEKLKDNHILFSETYTHLGQLYYHLGAGIDTVEAYFLKARDIVEANFDNKHPLYAEAIKNLAFLYVEKGLLDDALVLLNQADNIWSESLGNKNKSSGEVARLKGDIYVYRKNHDQALKEYEKSARYFRKIFSKSHPDYLNSMSKLAQAYYMTGDLNKVEAILSETTLAYLDYTKTYFPTLSEEEKAKFWAKIKSDFEFYNTVAVAYRAVKPKYLEDMYDHALATKGLLLNSSIKTRNSILHSGDSVLIAQFEKWLEKKEFLTTTLSQSEEDLLANGIDVNELKEEIALLEKDLSEKSQAFAESFEYEFYSWEDVQGVLNEDEAAIEIVRYRQFDEGFNEDSVRYAALIVTSETKKNPMLVLLNNGKEMENRALTLQRNSVKYKIKEERSYKTYWESIEQAISGKSIVYLSPDGVYNQVNIESLWRPDGNFVIDTQNIRVVNSTKSLAIYRSRAAKKARKDADEKFLTAMLFGNPDYYEDPVNQSMAKEAAQRGGSSRFIPQLPGTEREVKMISELLQDKGWETKSYIGDRATEARIKNVDEVTLLHIATHGFFDDEAEAEENSFQLLDEDNPLNRAGLLTKGAGDVLLATDENYNIDDGVLTAYEAMNLSFDKTELVVLSACETGRGEVREGEGVFGLQRSFLVAGADALIMSLFQVSDEVTRMLMVEFYENWLSGQDKRVAFNNAQLTVKESYPDPIYWGAFMMVGKQ